MSVDDHPSSTSLIFDVCQVECNEPQSKLLVFQEDVETLLEPLGFGGQIWSSSPTPCSARASRSNSRSPRCWKPLRPEAPKKLNRIELTCLFALQMKEPKNSAVYLRIPCFNNPKWLVLFYTDSRRWPIGPNSSGLSRFLPAWEEVPLALQIKPLAGKTQASPHLGQTVFTCHALAIPRLQRDLRGKNRGLCLSSWIHYQPRRMPSLQKRHTHVGGSRKREPKANHLHKCRNLSRGPSPLGGFCPKPFGMCQRRGPQKLPFQLPFKPLKEGHPSKTKEKHFVLPPKPNAKPCATSPRAAAGAQRG